MPDANTPSKLPELLASFFNAGWEQYKPMIYRKTVPNSGDTTTHGTATEQCVLQRTCLVLGVVYAPYTDELRLTPIVSTLPGAKRGMELFDAMDQIRVIKPSYHGLVPLLVDAVAARHGLLDPTRFTLSDHRYMTDGDFLRGLYVQIIPREIAAWLDITQREARQRIDDDSDAQLAIRSALYHAPDVLPDPVPMAAAMGITLCCWRNTEIENLHVARKQLTDVVMAKLNIATTRSIRRYVTTSGIDWESVAGLLLDPERLGANGTSVGDLIGSEWSRLAASIDQELTHWQHVQSVVGPRATVRLLSVMGSSDYTKRWWGNSWWPTFSSQVFEHVEDSFPQLLPEPEHEFSSIDLRSDVVHQPDELSDDVLAALIDPPDGKGLRHGPVPRPRVQVLRVADGA
jgi:hypothetical protein